MENPGEQVARDVIVAMDNRPRCWYFQSYPKGCSRTQDECLMIHDHKVQAKPPICNFWEMDQCTFGDACVFLHDVGNDMDVRGEHVPNMKRSYPRRKRVERTRGSFKGQRGKRTGKLSWRSSNASK